MNQSYNQNLEIPARNGLHEPIDVTADFHHPKIPQTNHHHLCIPKSFITKTGREVIITEIGLIHPKYNGLKTTFAFDVTDGAADYRLSFDTETLIWHLEWEGDYA